MRREIISPFLSIVSSHFTLKNFRRQPLVPATYCNGAPLSDGLTSLTISLSLVGCWLPKEAFTGSFSLGFLWTGDHQGVFYRLSSRSWVSFSVFASISQFVEPYRPNVGLHVASFFFSELFSQ